MSPLEAVAERLRSFVALQQSSITNVEIEDRHGFEDLRRLLKLVSIADMRAEPAALANVWTVLLQLLHVPSVASTISPLPLPHAANPSVVSTAGCDRMLVVTDLRKSCITEGQVPPLAQYANSVPLSHPCRTPAAHATAAGSDNEHGQKARYAIDAAGTRIQDHAVMMAWLNQAEIVLKFMSGSAHAVADMQRDDASKHLSVDFQTAGLLALLSFLTYAPWTTPEMKGWAISFLSALARASGCARGDSTPDTGVTALVTAHAGMLLEWCRLRSLNGSWKEASNTSVRWIILAVVTSIRFPSMTPDMAARALPLAYRLIDDWEVTNVWIGASCIAHILEHAVAADIRTAAGGPLQPELLSDALARARTCRHPTMAHVLSYTTAAYMFVMHGMADQRMHCHLPALKKALHTGGSITSTGGVTVGLWDVPLDVMLVDAVRSLGLAGGAAAQYGILTWLPALIIMLGEQSCRHYGELLPPLCSAAASPDGRLACTGLHALAVCVHTSPAYWTAACNESKGTKSLIDGLQSSLEAGRRHAVREVITACVSACMNVAGEYAVLPALDSDGQLTHAAGIAQARSRAEAGDMVAHYARLCYRSLLGRCAVDVQAFLADTLEAGQGEQAGTVELVKRSIALVQAP